MAIKIAETCVTQRRFIEYCVEITQERITQQELADLAGVNQGTISRLLNGRSVASRSRYAALLALNQIRARHGLDQVEHDSVIWTW